MGEYFNFKSKKQHTSCISCQLCFENECHTCKCMDYCILQDIHKNNYMPELVCIWTICTHARTHASTHARTHASTHARTHHTFTGIFLYWQTFLSCIKVSTRSQRSNTINKPINHEDNTRQGQSWGQSTSTHSLSQHTHKRARTHACHYACAPAGMSDHTPRTHVSSPRHSHWSYSTSKHAARQMKLI